MLTQTIMSTEKKASNYVQVGLDIHQNIWVASYHNVNKGKHSIMSYKIPFQTEQFYDEIEDLVKTCFEVTVVYEAGRYGFTPARRIQGVGASCHIVPVNKLEIQQSGKKRKTDRIDAKLLSDICLKNLAKVWIPSIEEESDRMMMRERLRLRKDTGRKNNQIISLLQQYQCGVSNTHFSSKLWQKKFKEWQKEQSLPMIVLKRIQLLIEELTLLEKHEKRWGKEIFNREKMQRCQLTQADYQIDILREYKGISNVIARTLVWEIGNFNRFSNGRKFASYLGLTPTPWSSGGKEKEQGISKEGRSELRRLAVQLAWLWVRFQPKSALAEKWQARLGKGARGRKTAIVALARALMVALYRRIAHGEEIKGATKNNKIKEQEKI